MDLPPDAIFADMGFTVHHWDTSQTGQVTALQREPFRLTWAATKLVTFVFLVHTDVTEYSDIVDQYPQLLDFAKRHKRTVLPKGIQCGYALLPIYIAESFEARLQERVRTDFKKRWCVFHVPALLEIATSNIVTLRHGSFWGEMYRDYVRATTLDVANAVVQTARAGGRD